MAVFQAGRFALPLHRTYVMGILNVTPDSFSDGGAYLDPEAAVEHGLDMVRAGAAIVDVGGESTRPGATPVTRYVRAPDKGRHRKVTSPDGILVPSFGATTSIRARSSSCSKMSSQPHSGSESNNKK